MTGHHHEPLQLCCSSPSEVADETEELEATVEAEAEPRREVADSNDSVRQYLRQLGAVPCSLAR